MRVKAFSPDGNTVKITADVTAPTGVQVPENSTDSTHQIRVHNSGLVTAFLAWGITAGAAQSAAVIPTGSGANAKASYPLPAGIVEVFTAPINSYFSAITASGTADIFITSGNGI